MEALDRLCLTEVFRYLGIAALFATRACSRALRGMLAPGVVHLVWARLRPRPAALDRQLYCPDATPQSLELLWTVYGFELDDLRGGFRPGGTPLHSACAHGELERARWLVSRGAYMRQHIVRAAWWPVDGGHGFARMYASAFARACGSGKLPLVLWLLRTFRLTAADARADTDAALQLACANGRLAVVMWLIIRFGITAGDLRGPSRRAVHLACEGGHRRVAHWLCDRIGPC
jgi:ankyrin repeat protein